MYYPLPQQNIPESQKTDDWMRKNVRALVQLVDGNNGRQQMASICFDLLNGRQNSAEFDYLTKMGDKVLPARVRSIPIIKPQFDLLMSSKQERPFEPRVFAVDQVSVDDKKDQMMRKVMDRYLKRFMSSAERIQMARMQLDQFRQGIQQQAEQGANDPMVAMRLQQAEMKLQQVEKDLQRDDDILQEELQKMERESRFDFQTEKEMRVSGGVRFLLAKYGYKEIFDRGFEHIFAVDNAIYTIDDVREGEDPKIRLVNPMNYFYVATPEALFLDECAGVERMFLSREAVLDRYGEQMTPKERDGLGKNYADGWGNYGQYRDTTGPNDLVGCSDGNLYGGSILGTNMVRVCRCAWPSVRKLSWKESDNPHDSEVPFLHALGEGKKIKDGDRQIDRYVTDWWEGTMVGSGIFVNMRRRPFQFRDVEKIGRSYGPYIGYAYNNDDRRPYSRVFAVRDLQVLYNLVWYQAELLMALGGVKGFIMDKNQVPKGMEPEEWLYQLKMGVGWINSVDDQGRAAQFNQFPMFDMTIGASLEPYMGVLERIEYMISRVIGIPPQRMGETKPSDQVGTFNSAIAQSNLTTETMFVKAEVLERRVMNRVIEALGHAWRNGRRGQYVLGTLGQQMFHVDSDTLMDARYEVFFQGSSRESKIMDRAFQLLGAEYQRGTTITLSNLLNLYNTNSLHELQKMMEGFESTAQRRLQESEQDKQISAERQQQVAAEYQAMVEKQKSDMVQMQGQLEQASMQLEDAHKRAELSVKQQEIQTKAETSKYQTDSERGVEMAYLQEERRKTDVDARLRMMEMAVESVAAAAKASSSSSNSPRPSASKASGKPKEKVKD